MKTKIEIGSCREVAAMSLAPLTVDMKYNIMCSYDIIFHVFKQSRREVNTP